MHSMHSRFVAQPTLKWTFIRMRYAMHFQITFTVEQPPTDITFDRSVFISSFEILSSVIDRINWLCLWNVLWYSY